MIDCLNLVTLLPSLSKAMIRFPFASYTSSSILEREPNLENLISLLSLGATSTYFDYLPASFPNFYFSASIKEFCNLNRSIILPFDGDLKVSINLAVSSLVNPVFAEPINFLNPSTSIIGLPSVSYVMSSN